VSWGCEPRTKAGQRPGNIMICRIRQFNPDAGSAIIQINMGNTRSTLAPLARTSP